MLKHLLSHEIQSLLKSNRVYWTVCMFILLFASVFIVRVVDYQKQVNQYIADVAQNEQELQEAKNYSHLNPRAIQQPIIFSIYNEGFKISRVVDVIFYQPIEETTKLNEEKNRLSLEETSLDITFLITFFLSLFILLISYDSVNGEKRVGTLRILMTYPLKRQSFILKKILGVFVFVGVTFTLPYILSLFALIVIYANLLTVNFFLSAFFYWFLTMLFIFFFSLLGIFISCCSISPNRSLVYSLLVWIMFSIILPISWEYIISPNLYHDKLLTLEQINTDKWTQLNKIQYSPPAEVAAYGNYYNYNSAFYGAEIWAPQETLDRHYRFQRYMYDEYFPVARETEATQDDVYRKKISIEDTKTFVFFYNPIVLFSNLANKITGNSQNDLLKFLQDARAVRDELVNIGATEEWLFDYRFTAIYAEEFIPPSWEQLQEEYADNMEELMIWMMGIMDRATPFRIDMPVFNKYQQPIFTFGEIFSRIIGILAIFVVSIIVLWLLTWQRFMKYDVR